ncbi:MAG TPA: hypothetical protein VIQ24_22105 [Pyrinomonadaceae bacterium]
MKTVRIVLTSFIITLAAIAVPVAVLAVCEAEKVIDGRTCTLDGETRHQTSHGEITICHYSCPG